MLCGHLHQALWRQQETANIRPCNDWLDVNEYQDLNMRRQIACRRGTYNGKKITVPGSGLADPGIGAKRINGDVLPEVGK